MKKMKSFRSEEDIAREAINHALRALKKRHLLEEGAHSPAVTALSRPFTSQASGWKDKAESLELKLQQCYKAQSRLSEQLVTVVAESRSSKASLEEKETLITDLQKESNAARDELFVLNKDLEEKLKALELVVAENRELRAQLADMTAKYKNADAENKMLIDRWMMQKLKDSEQLNQANALYEDMANRLKANDLEKLARQQVDGVVRRSEEGAEYFMLTFPSVCKRKIRAHEGGCDSIQFEHSRANLVTGGQDRLVKIWDTNTGALSHTLHGSLGAVLDLTVTHDGTSVIAASSSNQLYIWEVSSGRMLHTLTGHKDKVCAVDKISSRLVASAAYDRTIKIWDLQSGYCADTVIFHSNCNALCVSVDGETIYSGHVDGSIRVWDVETGKQVNEVAAHPHGVASVSLSRNGKLVLSSGRDNVHNLFHSRSMEVCGRFRAGGCRLGSNWSRSCVSPDDKYIAAGSGDGTVYIWEVSKLDVVSILKKHTGAVLGCSWSGLGKPLASADGNGVVCTWD